MEHILTYIIFFPLAGMVAIFCLPRQAESLVKWVALGFTLPPLILGIWLYGSFDRSLADLQFVVQVPWIPSYNIEYLLA
jgi:NADH-quinone oxidoreductase subunit M